jgi:molecular chaperone HscB
MKDDFSLFGIAPVFDIDLKQLEAAYFSEQRKFHPDRFIGKSEQERLAAMQRSVDINKAYQVLKEPLSRAQYLLKLQGITVGSEKDSVKPSQALLVEVMEWREAAEEGKDITSILQQQREESLQHIANHYKNAAWEKMAQETLRLGYIEKTLKEI